jgi:transposase
LGKAPCPVEYERKKQSLTELEHLSQQGLIDLFYADETGVSTDGYVPYGWVGKEEKIGVRLLPGTRHRINCFGLLSRDCRFEHATTEGRIDSDFIIDYLEGFSQRIEKQTVVVLDNAPVHKTRKLMDRREAWEQQGLFLFYLPPYSPHLNIIETLWRVLKGKWLQVEDYSSRLTLFEATRTCLKQIGIEYLISFSKFTLN